MRDALPVWFQRQRFLGCKLVQWYTGHVVANGGLGNGEESVYSSIIHASATTLDEFSILPQISNINYNYTFPKLFAIFVRRVHPSSFLV